MNNTTRYIFFSIAFVILGVGIFSSCSIDDKSQGPVYPLDDVTITGIMDNYENAYVGHDFSISPSVKNISGNLSHLRYLWISYNNSSIRKADTLSHEKDLNVKMNLSPGSHTMKFRVTDSNTGVFYEKVFEVNVVNDFTNGLIILSENDGKAQLDFWIPGRKELLSDIFTLMNPDMSLGENPQRVVFTPYTNDLSSEVLVLCQDGKGGRILDSTTMLWKRDYRDLFIDAKTNPCPQAYFKANMREYLLDDGYIYDRAVNSNPPDMQVRSAMSTSKGEYKIAPDADFGDEIVSPDRMVFYDNKGQRFLIGYSLTSAYLTPATATTGVTYQKGGAFNPNDVGLECIYANICMRNANGAREYACVCLDQEKLPWLLRVGIGFWVEGVSPNRYFKDISKTLMMGAGTYGAKTFACNASYPDYLFYANGSAVYAYSMSGQSSKKLYDFADNGETAVVDRIELEREGKRLWVAFRDMKKDTKAAGFVGLSIQTDGGLKLIEDVRHDNIADRIVDFESKY